MEYSKPIQFLVTEHEVITSVLDAVEAMAQRGDEEFEQTFFEKAFDFFPTFADKFHHAKEEDLLFPLLEARGIPREGGPIGCMLADHDEGRAHVGAVREALKRTAEGDSEARAIVRNEALAYVNLLHQHIIKENTILYVVGDQQLTSLDKEELLQKFDQASNEVLPFAVREKYLALARELRAAAGLSEKEVKSDVL